MLNLKRRFKRLRKGEQYENLYTALDIGTEYIKALVVRREGRNGVVLGASRERQAFADMQAGVPSDIQGIIETCDRAMSRAEDMCDTIPGQAVIGIAGEQVKGFSTSVTVPRADPQLKINEVELVQTLQLVEKRAMREARHLMSLELGVPDVDVKLINSAITSVRIDGFTVSNPLDFQGKQMVVSAFNTFAPLTHIGALQTIASELDLELVAAVAEPYAMARCVATDEVYDFGGIFIDIGGGTTDVALVRNGGIEAGGLSPRSWRPSSASLLRTPRRSSCATPEASCPRRRPNGSMRRWPGTPRCWSRRWRSRSRRWPGATGCRTPSTSRAAGARCRRCATSWTGSTGIGSPSDGPRRSPCCGPSTSAASTTRPVSCWISRTSLQWDSPSTPSSRGRARTDLSTA